MNPFGIYQFFEKKTKFTSSLFKYVLLKSYCLRHSKSYLMKILWFNNNYKYPITNKKISDKTFDIYINIHINLLIIYNIIINLYSYIKQFFFLLMDEIKTF